MSKWIRTTDRRPAANKMVLFVTDGEVRTGCIDEESTNWIAYDRDGTSLVWDALGSADVEYWRPLPKPPKPKPDLHKHHCDKMPDGAYLELDSARAWSLKRDTGQNWGLTLIGRCWFCPYCGVEL